MCNECCGFQYKKSTVRGKGLFLRIGNKFLTSGFNDYQEKDIVDLLIKISKEKPIFMHDPQHRSKESLK
jgi:hypothetical protein